MNREQMLAYMCAELQVGLLPDDIAQLGPTGGCELAPFEALPAGEWEPLPSEVKRPDGSIDYLYCPFADCPEGLTARAVLIVDDVCYVGGSSWALFHFRFRRA